MKPPELHDGDPKRHATWLELFFDLVFVVAITEVAHLLHKPLDDTTFVLYLLLYVPIYWAWVGHTVYANRFDTDDLFFRLATFGMMVAALCMAVPISTITEGGTEVYAAGYLAARLLLIALYARAWWHLPEARPMTSWYLLGFGAAASCWIASLFVPPPARYLLWVAGLTIDFVTPWIKRRMLSQYPLHQEHFPERMGLFTIIVLGESIIATEAGLSSVKPEGPWITTAIMGFMVMASIWWLYFTFVQHAKLDKALRNGLAYIYVHLPLTIGISMLAVAIGHLVKEAAKAHPHVDTLILLGVGSAMFLGAFFGIMWKLDHRHMRKNLVAAFIVAIVAVIALSLIGAGLSPPWVVGLLLGVFLVLVVLDMQYGLPATEITDEPTTTHGEAGGEPGQPPS
ncbi:MAG: low temperature requirement protein A [Candidatus Sericytochromatia bacterium]